MMYEACEDSRVGGMTGWRLPYLSELAYMFQNRDTIGGFTPGNYWAVDAEWMPGSWTRFFYYSFYSGSSSAAIISWGGYDNNVYNARCVKSAN